MNNIIIKGKYLVKEASKEEAISTNKVLLAGKSIGNEPKNRKSTVKETTVEQAIVKEATTDIVAEACEIPEFLLKIQEERKIQRRVNAQRANKKKAPAKKPSKKNTIISILKQI